MGSSTGRGPRLLAITTAAVLAVGVSACSSSKSSSSSGSSGSGKSGGSFSYWSMWRQDEPQAKVIQAAITQFTADTGIKVNVEWTGRDVAKKIGPAMAAGKAPDMWDEGADVIYGAAAQNGNAKDLSAVLGMTIPTDNEKVSDAIPSKYFDSLPKDPDGGQHWVVPYEASTAGVFYNSADPTVSAAMTSQPATWDDFIKVCDALKAKSEPCLASEGEDSWTNGLWFDYLLNAGGVNFNDLATDKTGAGWDNPAVLKAAQQVEQLVKGGYIIPTYTATKYPAQQTNWAGGKAGFLMNGNWVTAEVAKQIPATWKYGFMLPPGATQPDSMVFGFALTKNAKNVSQAEQFMAYFLQKKTLSGISTEAGNITPRTDIPAPAELADVQKTLNAPKLRLTFDGVAGDWTTKVWNQNYLDFWHGKIDAATFVSKMKSAQVSFWKSQS
ncbi:ABC-type glycerol-3-phosphate transport system substrate-binding protein [Catenulispora sp. GAS73]|uniref:ABC transporter substrate-binding protein n=1 Tax=Catenulispora sp. GAS73 TaxID=3156269 RepID=UPI003512F7DD